MQFVENKYFSELTALEAHPLQQGLRHKTGKVKHFVERSLRGTSITTRIKTKPVVSALA